MLSLENSILDISHNYYKYLLSLENVNGIGMGYKFINDKNTKEICLNVFVDEKMDIKYLSKNNIIPENYMGIKTDVIKTGKLKITSREKIPQRFRPLEGGASISIGFRGPEGTIGCIAFKKSLFKKEFFILSGNHVLADANKMQIGTTVLQPSDGISGKFPKDVVGYLTSFIPIKFIEGNNEPINYVDCAIARISNSSLASKKIFQIGEITGVSKATLGLNIKKVGFVTGLTEGKVTAIGVTTRVPFGKKYAMYHEQIRADLGNSSGDSGSLVLNNKNEAVGLLMAAYNTSDVIFNDISLVLKALNVKIYK